MLKEMFECLTFALFSVVVTEKGLRNTDVTLMTSYNHGGIYKLKIDNPTRQTTSSLLLVN